jgi:hypothetical protein
MALEFVKLVKGKDAVSQVGSLGFFKLGVESGGGDMEFSRVFSENSPATISAVSAQISANNMTSAQVEETYGWKIGDTKDITLSTGEVIQMRIIGFNHDDKSDGSGKAGFTLDMTHCLATKAVMNTSGDNAGGYPESDLRNTTFTTIRQTIPQDWLDVIKKVNKKSANGGGSNYSKVVTSSEDLFLLSEIEVFGSKDFAEQGAREGSQYEYFIDTSNTDRIKKYDTNGDGVVDTATTWMLRSARENYTGYYCGVSSSGGRSSNIAKNRFGVSFAFCI